VAEPARNRIETQQEEGEDRGDRIGVDKLWCWPETIGGQNINERIGERSAEQHFPGG